MQKVLKNVVLYLAKKMAQHNKLGADGEKAALEFLKSKGFQFIATNWRFGKYEIDIIAFFENKLIIIEVKTRETDAYGHPSEFLSLRQMRNITEAAEVFMQTKNMQMEARFDLITLLKTPTHHFHIEHFPAAFHPYEL